MNAKTDDTVTVKLTPQESHKLYWEIKGVMLDWVKNNSGEGFPVQLRDLMQELEKVSP